MTGTQADHAAHGRLELRGMERLRYFAPSLFLGYLAALSAGLAALAPFLERVSDPLAIAAVGLFGLFVSGSLAALLLRLQLRDLRYLRVDCGADAASSYERVHRLACAAGWRLTGAQPPLRLDACAADPLLGAGELVSVRFDGDSALLACVCNPRAGFSLASRRRCRQLREQIAFALAPAVTPGE